jgi:hypothetical protein
MAPEVLRNPASHLQESAAVSQEVLAAKGIRPYDEKVRRQCPSPHKTHACFLCERDTLLHLTSYLLSN